MNSGLIKSSSAVLVAGLLLTGCENMSPGANGAVFGTGAGILAGGLARAAGASPSEAVAIGLATGAVVGVTAYVIAKHKATERQRRYAEERARLAYENASAQRKARYRQARYIAVDTVREKDSSGAKSVMIYDTQTQQVVGNNVYDVKQTPKQGTVSKYDTYSAEYVGTGT
jgi:predicted lipid-binding transport protein (Tim44 family)